MSKFDIEAVTDKRIEQAVISAALLDPDALDIARNVIGEKSEFFFSDPNRRIWEAICELDDDGQGVDLATLARRLKDIGRLDQVGGTPYISEVFDSSPAIGNVKTHAERLRQLWIQREVIKKAQVTIVEGQQQVDATRWAIQKADELQDLTSNASTITPESTIREQVVRVIEEMQQRRRGERVEGCTPTGWPAVNKILGGWLSGNLYFAAGRPGMGKTAFGLQEVLNVAAVERKAGMFIGLEMPDVQVVQRAISLRSSVPVHHLVHGHIGERENAAVIEAGTDIAKLPVFIGDNGGMSVAQIRGVVRRQLRKLRSIHGEGLELGLVVVDYLQLIRAPYRQGQNREQEIASISAGLKMMAKEFKTPVLSLAQLSRKCEERADKRPTLSDLRESGSLEQDGYGIIFLYRDDYYNKEKSSAPGVVEVDIAKHRNGPTGVAKLDFNAEFTRFDNPPDPHAAYGFDEPMKMPDWHN